MLRKQTFKRSGFGRIAVVIGTLVTLLVVSESVLAEPGDLLSERRGRRPRVPDPARTGVETAVPTEVIPIDPPAIEPKRQRVPPRHAPAAAPGGTWLEGRAAWWDTCRVYLALR
jgi:hypothetical protein